MINRPPDQEKKEVYHYEHLGKHPKELISARVEQLAHEAEQHPDCIKSKEQMLPLRSKADQLMGEDDAEELGQHGARLRHPHLRTLLPRWTGGRNAPQGDAGADEKALIQSFRETP